MGERTFASAEVRGSYTGEVDAAWHMGRMEYMARVCVDTPEAGPVGATELAATDAAQRRGTLTAAARSAGQERRAEMQTENAQKEKKR